MQAMRKCGMEYPLADSLQRASGMAREIAAKLEMAGDIEAWLQLADDIDELIATMKINEVHSNLQMRLSTLDNSRRLVSRQTERI